MLTLEQMKKLLDDPSLSDEQRERLQARHVQVAACLHIGGGKGGDAQVGGVIRYGEEANAIISRYLHIRERLKPDVREHLKQARPREALFPWGITSLFSPGSGAWGHLAGIAEREGVPNETFFHR